MGRTRRLASRSRSRRADGRRAVETPQSVTTTYRVHYRRGVLFVRTDLPQEAPPADRDWGDALETPQRRRRPDGGDAPTAETPR
jgi:hypothetical protein